MCTAISFSGAEHYFGRNLDLEYSYQETVTITPRQFPLAFRKMPTIDTHYAFIGMAYVRNDYPLYYDATNEYGLSMAGLNFPHNAVYLPPDSAKDNIAPFELIPWVLAQCKTVRQSAQLLKKSQLINEAFQQSLPLTRLHWLLSDANESLVLEPGKAGLVLYENPVGVLTNNPPFPYHLTNLSNYMALSPKTPGDHFSPVLSLRPYSKGMGAMGLPGDLSSASRFVRASFTLHNSHCAPGEASAVSQFFHILGAVEQQEGCVQLDNGYEKTIYSSCCNTSKGIYYYKTYDNSQITAVSLRHEDLDGKKLISYPLRLKQEFYLQN